MADKINGTILQMRALSPLGTGGPINGQIWKSRETSEPRRESIFAWDPTPYDGPLYFNPDVTEDEVPQYIGFAPNIENLRDGSAGVWRWIDPPRGSIDAERVYGVSAKTDAVDNGKFFQRCIDEVLNSYSNWPRPAFPPDDPDPGIGDSWTVQLPTGTIELDPRDGNNISIPITFNRKTAKTSIFTQCNYPDERVTVAGRIILQGQGLTTILKYVGAPNHHAFLLGSPPGERHESGCVTTHFGRFILKDLQLHAATDASFAILRMWQVPSRNIFENIALKQFGNGDGINANEMVFSEFSQVDISRGTDAELYPGPLPFSGRAFWLHTDDFPYFVSGQTTISRLSVFGSFNEGITFGENALDSGGNNTGRLLCSVAAQYINAEHCLDGIVFGRGAANIDVSVAWVEGVEIAGVRFKNGAQNIAMRQVYTFNSEPDDPANTYEGDIVFGVDGGTGAENSYAGITVDGIYQHFIYGPAARFFHTTDASIRDITVRNVFIGFFFEGATFANELFGGQAPGENVASGSGLPSNTVTPIAEAMIQLDKGTYDGLVIERVRPYTTGALPDNASGQPIQLINRPELVDRIVFSGPYDAPFSHGVYELVGPTVARRGLTHTANYTIRHNDPMYHRVDTDVGNQRTITLPRITRTSGIMIENRLGLEYHIMWIGGFGANRKLRGQNVDGIYTEKIFGSPVPSGVDFVSPSANYAYVRVRAVSEPGGTPHWEIIDFENVS